jgi:hypothetical protein
MIHGNSKSSNTSIQLQGALGQAQICTYLASNLEMTRPVFYAWLQSIAKALYV